MSNVNESAEKLADRLFAKWKMHGDDEEFYADLIREVSDELAPLAAKVAGLEEALSRVSPLTMDERFEYEKRGLIITADKLTIEGLRSELATARSRCSDLQAECDAQFEAMTADAAELVGARANEEAHRQYAHMMQEQRSQIAKAHKELESDLAAAEAMNGRLRDATRSALRSFSAMPEATPHNTKDGIWAIWTDGCNQLKAALAHPADVARGKEGEK